MSSHQFLGAVFATSVLVFAIGGAEACSRSNVEPGNNTTNPVHVMKRGASCGTYFDLEGWEIHSMRIVQPPRNGRLQFSGRNRLVYTAGPNAGSDEFTIELDTTQFDWQTGRQLSRMQWRVKTPFIIQ